MRVLLGLVGAVIGAAIGVYFLGSYAGDMYMQSTEFQSPDEAGDSHSTVFLATSFATMMVGYFIGWFIGKSIQKS